MSEEQDEEARKRKHDESYKLAFTHKELIRELLQHFVPPELVAHLRLDKIDKIDAAFVSLELTRRDADMIWEIPYDDGSGSLYVYLMLEFQSKVDPFMTLRMGRYVNLLQEGLSLKDTSLIDALPPVLPIVLYNGKYRWSAHTHTRQQYKLDPSAPLYDYQPQIGYHPIDIGRLSEAELDVVDSVLALMFQVEQGSVERVHGAVSRLARMAHDSALLGLWDAILAWLKEALRARELAVSPQDIYTFQEAETMTGQTFTEWARERDAEFRQELRQEIGQEERLEGQRAMLGKLMRLKFGEDARLGARIAALDEAGLDAALERILSADTADAVFDTR